MLTSNWINMNQKVLPIGLDIGHGWIKMIQLAHADDRVKVLSVERAPVNLDPTIDGQEKKHSIALIIKQMLTRGKFRGREAVSALSSDELRITSLRLAETETFQTDRAVRKEAAQRFGLDLENDAINYLLAGTVHQGDDVKNEFVVLAADNETIRSHIGLLENAGLQPTGIDAAPCALFRNFERTMRREEDRQRTIVFVDVGHQHTTAVFGRNGEICFVKQLPFGAMRFNEAVASNLDVTLADAESLRRKLHRDESVEAATHRLVVDALTSAAEELAKELSLCLRYHTVTFRGKRVERAVIAGGGAYESVLLDVLRRHLSMQIDVAEPLRGFDIGAIDVDEDGHYSSADLALAVGLSLKGTNALNSASAKSHVRREPILEGEQR